MVMHIVNYLIRGLIIVIGIIFASGIFTPKSEDSSLMRVMGVVLILWGIYRILTYRMKYRQMLREQKRDED